VTEVTVASIKAKLETDDPAQTFLFNLVKKSDYDAIGSPEKFLEKELKALEEEALDSDGVVHFARKSIWYFLLSDVELPKAQNLNRDELEINTEYYIYAYGIDVKGEITTPLVRRLVKTNDLKEINFNLTVEDEGQTTATLKGNPDEKFTYYYLGYTSKTEYEDSFKGDDQQVIDNALGSIRMGIGNDGSKLPDVASVRMGEGSLEVEGLLPDTEYYALAFGIDKKRVGMYETHQDALQDRCGGHYRRLQVRSVGARRQFDPDEYRSQALEGDDPLFRDGQGDRRSEEHDPGAGGRRRNSFPERFHAARRLVDRSACLHGRSDAPFAPQSGRYDHQARNRLYGLCLRRKRGGSPYDRGGDRHDADDGRRAPRR